MRAPLSIHLLVFAFAAACACGPQGSDDGVQVSFDASPLPNPDAAVPAPPPAPDPEFDYYWILGQNPGETDIYLYAREGAIVTFGGTIASPTVVNIPPDEFTELNVGELGYAQSGSEWYFLELSSTKDLMVSFDRSVQVQTGATTFERQHGDALHNKPPRELSTHLYFPLGSSGANDDILNVYAHQPTTMTIKAVGNTGTEVTHVETFEGLFTSPKIRDWLSGINTGYSLEIESDQPIAAALFDELPKHPNLYSGSGYYFGNVGLTGLYTEYLQIRQSYDRYQTIYMPNDSDISFHDKLGTQIGNTFEFGALASTFIRDNEVGFEAADHPLPYVLKVEGSVPFADRSMTPTATDIRESAAFMGWNSNLGNLEIYAEEATRVDIYDGRTQTLLATWELEAQEVIVQNMLDIGFPPAEPFLALVVADKPIYQQIQDSRYLRQYPGGLGPIID